MTGLGSGCCGGTGVARSSERCELTGHVRLELTGREVSTFRVCSHCVRLACVTSDLASDVVSRWRHSAGVRRCGSAHMTHVRCVRQESWMRHALRRCASKRERLVHTGCVRRCGPVPIRACCIAARGGHASSVVRALCRPLCRSTSGQA